MNFIIYLYIFILGTILGSFSSVIISRIRKKEKGIFTGRSHCTSCNHTLSAKNLIPIFSFLFSKGKCSYCKTKISIFYPILELVMGLFFLFISYFLIDITLLIQGNILEIIKLFFWLSTGFLTIVFVVYDILYLEIPESILLIGIILTFFAILLQSIIPNFQIIQTLPTVKEITTGNIILLVSSILIIGGLYYIMLGQLKSIYDIFILIVIGLVIILVKKYTNINISDTPILSGLIGALGIFIFFFLQILVSGGTWMGGGDLRIAILLGLILGAGYTFAGGMISYLSGSIIGVGIIINQRIKNKKSAKNLETQVPFGPFLAAGLFLALFSIKIIDNIILKFF